jgi:hypothetical protein
MFIVTLLEDTAAAADYKVYISTGLSQQNNITDSILFS